MSFAISSGAVEATAPSRSIRRSERPKGTAIVVTFGVAIVGAAFLLARNDLASRENVSASDSAGETRVLEGGARQGFAPVSPESARMTVQGRILDSEGHPVSGERVEVESDAGSASKWVTHTQADGAFSVDGVRVGKVRIRAGDAFAGNVESALLGPTDGHGIVLVLSPTREVGGVVLDERGAPVARARMRWSGKGEIEPRIASTDEQGRYTLQRAEDDADRLTVWADGFEAETIVLASGNLPVQRRDVRLHRASPLHGFVVGPSGDPVAGARVLACQGEEIAFATSDDAGGFELPAVTAGCWVTAGHPRFGSATHRRIGDTRPLTIRLGAGGAVEGTVVDLRQRPVGAFSLSIVSVLRKNRIKGVRSRAGETMSFLRGAFHIGDLAPGTYVLRAHAEGKLDAQSAPIDVDAGKVIGGEQLVLTDEGNPPETTSGEMALDSAGAEATPEATEGQATASEAEGPNADFVQ